MNANQNTKPTIDGLVEHIQQLEKIIEQLQIRTDNGARYSERLNDRLLKVEQKLGIEK